MAVFTATSSVAQDASRIYIEPTGWSLGTSFGLSDMWGDVGTKSFLDHYTNSKYFDKVALLGGLFGRYTVHPALSVRMSLNAGAIYATDEWNYDKAIISDNQGTDAYQRYARGQNAKSNILEGSLLLELTPLRLNPEKKRAYRKGQPYLGAGIGYFHFTPYSSPGLSTKFVEIYDLHLEGDGFGDGFPPAYKLWQVCFPLAIGWRWDIGQHLNIGVEYMYRVTLNDYLDGVSGKYIDNKEYAKHMGPSEAATAIQVADKGYLKRLQQPNVAGNMRGNPGNNDAYSSLNVTFYYKVFTRSKQWWKVF
ncbi:MAG: hypothetical protein H7257_05145 [Taibaiella sp.]|nr:hypothetical protein [Taibaiella sp.]